MTVYTFSQYLKKLEQTASRNQMTEVLARLFKQATDKEIAFICYLLQGRLGPLFAPIEFGMADRMVVKALAKAYDVKEKEVRKLFRQKGDLGLTAEELAEKCQMSNVKCQMSVKEVYRALRQVAEAAGTGSQDEKLTRLAELLKSVDPLSCRYLTRIPLAKLRLGFSDMTVLDALSWMIVGSKIHRAEIERAFNVRPDLGFIAYVVKKKGIKELDEIGPSVGTPIRMAQAERMSSSDEIIDKIGRCAVEPKIDGFRLQAHVKRGAKGIKGEFLVRLFSRNLEDVTFMYPDIVEGIKRQIQKKEAIFEGEAVAYNPQSGEYLPFQETVQRKRKYNISQKVAEIPLKLICFDPLYVDGENLIPVPYKRRRQALEKLVEKGNMLMVVEEHQVDQADSLEQLFNDAVSCGLEGVMAKRLDGVYQAGARGWNWIKYKRSYAGKLSDTIDGVVMGYDFGQGKRTSFGIGAFLIGIYDEKSDTFKTIAKIGTGLSDDEWRRLKIQGSKFKVQGKPKNYDVDKSMECNVWLTPKIVVEIRADEITRSPVHTAGRKMGLSKSGKAEEVKTPGFALRFPRLERFRTDKTPADTTTLAEIEKMYGKQQRTE